MARKLDGSCGVPRPIGTWLQAERRSASGRWRKGPSTGPIRSGGQDGSFLLQGGSRGSIQVDAPRPPLPRTQLGRLRHRRDLERRREQRGLGRGRWSRLRAHRATAAVTPDAGRDPDAGRGPDAGLVSGGDAGALGRDGGTDIGRCQRFEPTSGGPSWTSMLHPRCRGRVLRGAGEQLDAGARAQEPHEALLQRRHGLSPPLHRRQLRLASPLLRRARARAGVLGRERHRHPDPDRGRSHPHAPALRSAAPHRERRFMGVGHRPRAGAGRGRHDLGSLGPLRRRPLRRHAPLPRSCDRFDDLRTLDSCTFEGVAGDAYRVRFDGGEVEVELRVAMDLGAIPPVRVRSVQGSFDGQPFAVSDYRRLSPW